MLPLLTHAFSPYLNGRAPSHFQLNRNTCTCERLIFTFSQGCSDAFTIRATTCSAASCIDIHKVYGCKESDPFETGRFRLSGNGGAKKNENYKHLNLPNFRISGRNLASCPWSGHGAGGARPPASGAIKVAREDGRAPGDSGSQASGACRAAQNDSRRSLETESRPERRRAAKGSSGGRRWQQLSGRR